MRWWILAGILAVGLTTTPAGAQPTGMEAGATAVYGDSAQAVVQHLKSVERAWINAYAENDVLAMDSLLAESFTITYPSGRIIDKERTLALLNPIAPKDGEERQYTQHSDVRLYGKNAAVITGIFVRKTAYGTRRSRYTDTYARIHGRWQVVASHLTRLSDTMTSEVR